MNPGKVEPTLYEIAGFKKGRSGQVFKNQITLAGAACFKDNNCNIVIV